MLGGFDKSIIAQTQQASDIVDIISEHLNLQKKGKELVGLCPFHTDHKPSLYVNPAKQIFKCFACGAGGDVFKFIQLRENLSFSQAVERLAARAGIQLAPPKRTQDGKSGSEMNPVVLADLNGWAVRFWQANLKNEQVGLAARNYIDKRQISGESVAKWNLGFAPDGWDNFLTAARKAGWAGGLLEKGGFVLAKSNEQGSFYDRFRNRLMFPIFDVGGRAIGFGGRTLGDDNAKYINSPATVLFDKSNCLYGLDKARHRIGESGVAIVVEGYTDCMMAHQFGHENVVATLGTSFTAGHARILRRYAKSIVLIFDSDTAGIEAANRALEVCLAEMIDIKIARVPRGKDPCDFILAEGGEAFGRIIAEALEVMEFKWQRLLDTYNNQDNFTDRRAATDQFFQTIASALSGGSIDAVRKGLIVSRLSRIMGLTPVEINGELNKRIGKIGSAQAYSAKEQRVSSWNFGDGPLAKAHRELLEVLLNEPRFFKKMPKTIPAKVSDVSILNQIGELLGEVFAVQPEASLRDILARAESVELASAIVELAAEGEKKANFETRFGYSVEQINKSIEYAAKNSLRADLKDEDTETLQLISKKIRNHDMRNPGIIF